MAIEQDIADIKKSVSGISSDLKAFQEAFRKHSNIKVETNTSVVETTVHHPDTTTAPIGSAGGGAASDTTTKQVFSFGQVRKACIDWIGPLVKKDKKQGQKVMQKLLDQFTDGEPLKPEFLTADKFEAVLEYIKNKEAK